MIKIIFPINLLSFTCHWQQAELSQTLPETGSTAPLSPGWILFQPAASAQHRSQQESLQKLQITIKHNSGHWRLTLRPSTLITPFLGTGRQEFRCTILSKQSDSHTGHRKYRVHRPWLVSGKCSKVPVSIRKLMARWSPKKRKAESHNQVFSL